MPATVRCGCSAARTMTAQGGLIWARMPTTFASIRLPIEFLSVTAMEHSPVIDPSTNGKIADIALHAHPESFQLARSDRRIFVNVPKGREIAVVDRFTGKQAASWATGNERFFPMALDEGAGRVLVAFRNPAQLGACS